MSLTKRFEGAPWFQSKDISVVGLGGAGRGIAETLFLQGHCLDVWDYDKTEAHNCIVQGYQSKYINKEKSMAFRMQMTEFVGDTSDRLNCLGKWNEDDYLHPIAIACPDNYETRNLMFRRWQVKSDREMFISVGLLADMYHIKVFFPGDEDKWVERNDSEEESTNCTYQQSMYCAKALHSKVTEIVNKYVMGLKDLIEHEYRYNGITG
jgi:hypothetical protein